jgi:hypothetical protein
VFPNIADYPAMGRVPGGKNMQMISILILALIASQTQNGQTELGSAHMATLCALVDHPSEYSGKTVQLQAKVVGGLEFSILRDDSCPATENAASGKHDLVLATFGQDHYDFKSRLNQKLSRLLKKNQQAEVVVVGTFTDPGKYMGHQLCCRYEFAMQRLISVKDVGK